MNSAVTAKKFPPPKIDEGEIFRRLHCETPDEVLTSLVCGCIKEAEAVLEYRVCCGVFDISVNGGRIMLPFGEIVSDDLAKRLEDCISVIVFGATVGLGLDRLIYKYGKLSPSRASVLQAIGTERVEALCDAFCREMSETLEKEGKKTVCRYSPGYGDLSLSVQKQIFSVLPLEKNVGMTLNESLLMSPSKSVTAFVGIKRL